jgi:hypothetical protein
MLRDGLLQLNSKFEECITNRLQFLSINVSKSVKLASFALHLALGGTLDRRCHFKHVSLKHSRFYHCQTGTAHRQRIKSRQCCYTKHKKFPYRPISDVSLLSGHSVYFTHKNEVSNISTVNPFGNIYIYIYIFVYLFKNIKYS